MTDFGPAFSTLFRGAPASPKEFIQKLHEPELILKFFQYTLGRPLDTDLTVSRFTRMILAELHRRFPDLFEKHKPQVFVPGMPENVALYCLVALLRRERFVKLELLKIFKGHEDEIVLNRVIALSLEHNPNAINGRDPSVVSGPMIPETIGLIDTARRTLNLLQTCGMLVAPVEKVDKSLAFHVYDHITNLLPILDQLKS